MNDEILTTIKPPLLLEATVLKQKLSDFGHMIRHKDGVRKDLMLGRMEGTRRMGRHCLRWIQ